MFEYLKLLYCLIAPNTIFVRHFSSAFGDNLLLTALLPELRKKYPDKKIIVETRFKDIFKNNPYVDWVTDKHFKTTKKFIKPKYRIFPDTEKSIYEQIASYAGSQKRCFPQLFLDENEIASAKNNLPDKFLTVCPVGKMKHSANRKEWGFENFQKIVNTFNSFKFVQIGSSQNPLLENVIDRRGLKIRNSASVLKSSLFFIGLEGGLMHLAKSVDTPSMIIYGGAINPLVSAYDENINISNKTDCSPCFTSEKPLSPCDTMKCMKDITMDRVAQKLQIKLKELNFTESKP
jgi:ADP-heptose:LPS heptosyltransferase